MATTRLSAALAMLITQGTLVWIGTAPTLTCAQPVEPPAAYQRAAQAAQIPVRVLYAIALQESGIYLRGQLHPWPWTLNVAGQPLRFSRQAAACQALLQALRMDNAKRIDAGLTQINLGYHGQRFTSPCAVLEPQHNLAVAAALLREHQRSTGDWILAAGRYHRPAGGAPAARYRQGFARHWARLQGTHSRLPLTASAQGGPR